MGCTPANSDVLTEILLHLPVKVLLRFRSVCKAWRDVIDSPCFRRWHVKQQADNEKDDTVFVQFSFLETKVWEVSMMFLDDGRSYNDFPAFKAFFKDYMPQGLKSTRVIGAVKGLICFHSTRLDPASLMNVPIGICNPSLGEIKRLPPSPMTSCSSHLNSREVGVGFDSAAQDYKVVQVLSCRRHCCLHAHVYSRRANSWRELGADSSIPREELYIHKPIKSTCKNGSFAHWHAFRLLNGIVWKRLILSFDMTTEVFRTVDLGSLEGLGKVKIFATDDSFLLFDCGVDRVRRIFRRNQVEWIPVPRAGALWRTDCVVLKRFLTLICDQDYVGCFNKPATASTNFKIVEYQGSFISP